MKLFSNQKIFCIGLHKTGTTSIERTLKDLGYSIGNQKAGELLLKDWHKRDFRKIKLLTKTAQAFQDTPFSLPYTYIVMHQTYPNAQFILTVRNSAEEWYRSIVQYHSKLWGSNDGNPPTKQQLKEANYIYKGRAYEANRMIFQTPENDLYHQPTMIQYYDSHLNSVRHYFKDSAKFIEINVSKSDDYLRLCRFLNKEPKGNDFPWLNKT